MPRHTKRRRGFTLVELLVVMAVISLLSSVVLSSMQSAREKAREGRKIAELRSMISAIKLYAEARGSFPANKGTTWCNPGVSYAGSVCLSELVSDGYFSTLPRSPDIRPYYYYNYGTFAMMSSRMVPMRYGPGPGGWHCSDATGGALDKIYCFNVDRL